MGLQRTTHGYIKSYFVLHLSFYQPIPTLFSYSLEHSGVFTHFCAPWDNSFVHVQRYLLLSLADSHRPLRTAVMSPAVTWGGQREKGPWLDTSVKHFPLSMELSSGSKYMPEKTRDVFSSFCFLLQHWKPLLSCTECITNTVTIRH